jgi:hypothetical protein
MAIQPTISANPAPMTANRVLDPGMANPTIMTPSIDSRNGAKARSTTPPAEMGYMPT